jgi:hypothetical protein
MNEAIKLFAQSASSSISQIKNGGLNAQRCNKNTIIKNAGRKINKSKKTRKSRITRKYRKTPHS